MNVLAEPIATAARVVSLGEAVELNPRADRGQLSDDLEVSFVPMAAVEAATGRMDTSTVRRFGELKKGYTIFREGDVLFAKITPCMENGKMAVARGLRNGVGCGSTEFHVLRPRVGVDPHYVYYFVSSDRFRAQAAHHMTGAVGQRRVPAAFLEECAIPLPNLSEQRRIVAEIERHVSRIEEAVANLRRSKHNLRQYKAAVLGAAIEGKLLAADYEFERAHPRNRESGSSHVNRSFDARRNVESQLEVNEGRSEVRPGQLPPLPEGWRWTSVIEVCERVVDCHNKTAPYVDAGIPLIRTSNIKDGRLLIKDTKYVDEATYKFWSRRCPPEPGDVLFTREAPMGEAAIIPTGFRICMGQRMMLMRPSGAISGKFLLAALCSPVVRRAIVRVAVGSGVKHLRVGDAGRLPIPLPPRPEQDRIVEAIERHLSIIDEMREGIDRGLARASVLRACVLAKAFAT